MIKLFIFILFGTLFSFPAEADTGGFGNWIDMTCSTSIPCPGQMSCGDTTQKCQCDSDADCPAGYNQCVRGKCYKSHECQGHSDCLDGKRCDGSISLRGKIYQNKCVCTEDRHCSDGKVCANGRCVCTEDGHCESGHICLLNTCVSLEKIEENKKLEERNAKSMKDCSTHEDCNYGRQCVRNLCINMPMCTKNSDCSYSNKLPPHCNRKETLLDSGSCHLNYDRCYTHNDCEGREFCYQRQNNHLLGTCGDVDRTHAFNRSDGKYRQARCQGMQLQVRLCNKPNDETSCASWVNEPNPPHQSCCPERYVLGDNAQCVECTNNSECRTGGHVCKNNKCVTPECRDASDCKKKVCPQGRPAEECYYVSTEEVCAQGLCIKSQCKKDRDCKDGKLCKFGVCTNPQCITDENCAEGRECKNTDFVGAYGFEIYENQLQELSNMLGIIDLKEVSSYLYKQCVCTQDSHCDSGKTCNQGVCEDIETFSTCRDTCLSCVTNTCQWVDSNKENFNSNREACKAERHSACMTGFGNSTAGCTEFCDWKLGGGCENTNCPKGETPDANDFCKCKPEQEAPASSGVR